MQSKTVWSALVAFLASLVSVGLNLDSPTSGNLAEVASQGVAAAFAAIAIYGRIVATKTLVAPTPTTPAPPQG